MLGGDDDTYDYFQITAPKSGELVVSLSGMTANLDLRLFDPTGVELIGSENPGTEDDQVVYDVEEGGQYVLQVAPTTDENSPYQVTMTLNGEAGYDGDVPDDDGFVGEDGDQDEENSPDAANDDGIVDGAVDSAGNVITPGEADDSGDQGGSDGGAVDGSTGDATVTADDTSLVPSGAVPGGAVPGGAVSGSDGTTVDAAGNVVGGGATDAAGNPIGATPGLARTASTSYSLAPETTDTDVTVFDSSAFG